MKSKSLITAVAVLTLAGASVASAQVIQFTFDTGLDGFSGNAQWSSTGPAGWSGGAAMQAAPTAGGWTMGDGGGPRRQFNVGSEEPMMQGIANAGNGWITFDVIFDGSSFPAGTAGWYQVWTAGNSDGSKGWTQGKLVDAWQNADQADLRVTHVERSFAEMGWEPGDTWFQVWLGGNSDGAFPLGFYVDNVAIVPEPSTFVLTGLGLALLWLVRRRS